MIEVLKRHVYHVSAGHDGAQGHLVYIPENGFTPPAGAMREPKLMIIASNTALMPGYGGKQTNPCRRN